jgi:N-methylhydantoinase B
MSSRTRRSETKLDPILVSIIPNRLDAIAEEMAQTLMMTSRSGIFAEARDFVTGLLDANGRLLAQSRYFPGFACALPYIVPPVIAKYKDDLHEGDVVFVNDPYSGNSHLPDMNILKPVFDGGKVRFWAVCKGHMADIGGAGVAGYDPQGETVWDEGVIVPPTKLMIRGALQEEMLDLLLRQVKLPDIVRGDILCQVGGVNIGERGLRELMGRYGIDCVNQHIDAYLSASEKAMRAKILGIPAGKYAGEKSLDDDVSSHRPLTVRVEVTVKDDEINFDFSLSDPQSPRYMNSTDAFTRSMAMLTVFGILEHGQSNDGSLRPFSFINPPGTCVHGEFPHSTVLATCSMAEAVQEAVQLALAPVVPEKVAAPSTKLIFPIISYIHPAKKRLDVIADFFFRCNPSGGTLGYDGWEQGGPAQEMGMGRCPDPEIHELTHPVRIHCFEQAIDSAGAGRFRGGNGHVYRVQYFEPSVKAVVFGSGTRLHAVPSGIFGGHDPEPSQLTIERASGTREFIPLNSFFHVHVGDVIELREMGGPGYGNPLERDVELVARDLRDGYLSIGKAAEVYGVVVDANGRVDHKATAALRENRRLH